MNGDIENLRTDLRKLRNENANLRRVVVALIDELCSSNTERMETYESAVAHMVGTGHSHRLSPPLGQSAVRRIRRILSEVDNAN